MKTIIKKKSIWIVNFKKSTNHFHLNVTFALCQFHPPKAQQKRQLIKLTYRITPFLPNLVLSGRHKNLNNQAVGDKSSQQCLRVRLFFFL